ncbi:MAG: T9SS type A sorting domain-containing protein [Flavobacterium sp.]|nr:T9SS type A sorting domain-containing protein [Flavobacterium sp.]
MKNNQITSFLLLLFLHMVSAQTSSLVSIGTDGKLVYTPDSKGNMVPDFSGVGYMNSESSIPTIAVVKTVNAVVGDNWTNVQNAINEVAALPLDSNGFRGAILFKSGTYELGNTINITAGGIVLRGEGFDGSGTNFMATKKSQHTLFNFAGASGKTAISSSTKKITDAYVPIGKKQITVASGHTFVVGDKVLIHRIPNDAWISLLGMDKISWADPLAIDWVASAYDVYSERKVMAVSGNVITLDAPIMDVIDPVYSTGELMKYTSSRIEKCGIENMRISSYFASDTDESHGWTAVSFANIANGWARNLEAYHFGYSAVHITSTASWITVDNCKMQDAKSIITGSRRYSFNVDGQRNLVTNCTTKNGRHDYVNGSRTCGPNVFYNNTATIQNSDIGPHHRWSTGVLFDNIMGNGSQDVQNRLDAGSGHGWSGGQIMFWNCTAGKMILQDPPGDERNWAIGCKSAQITNVGTVATESLGIVESQGTPIAAIPSLFEAQLSERLANLLSVKSSNLLDENTGISIHPNPAKDSITISRTLQMGTPISIIVYNTAGQKVKTLSADPKLLDSKYSISDLKEGIYFIHFRTVDFSKKIKLVVKK